MQLFLPIFVQSEVKLKKEVNRHNWNNDKPYEGYLQILNGNRFSNIPVCSLLSVCWLLLWRGRGL